MSVKARPEKNFRRANSKATRRKSKKRRISWRAVRIVVSVVLVVYAMYRAFDLVVSASSLQVRHIVVHGSVTVLGEPWLDAIRDEATRRSLGPLARETRIVDGGSGEDLTLVGACALLLTSELGLTVQR